jgi:hypothetical protein
MLLLGNGQSEIDSLLPSPFSSKDVLLWQLALALRHVKNIQNVCNSNDACAISCLVYVNSSKLDDCDAATLIPSITAEVQHHFNRSFDGIVSEEQRKVKGKQRQDWFPFNQKPASVADSSAQVVKTALKWYQLEDEIFDGEVTSDDDEDNAGEKPIFLPVAVLFVNDLPKGALVEVEVESLTQYFPTNVLKSWYVSGVLRDFEDSAESFGRRQVELSSKSVEVMHWPLWNSQPNTMPDFGAPVSENVETKSGNWKFDASGDRTFQQSEICAQLLCHSVGSQRSLCKGFVQVVVAGISVSSAGSVMAVFSGMLQAVGLCMKQAELSPYDLKCIKVFYDETYFGAPISSSHDLMTSPCAAQAMLTTTLENLCISHFGVKPSLCVLPVSSQFGSDRVPAVILQFSCLNLLQLDTDAWIWNGRQN